MLRAALFIGLAVVGTARADSFYDPADLARLTDRMVPNIRTVLERDIIGNLPRDARPAAGRIVLEFPEQGPDPLAFYAEPDRHTITMPLESLRFFDDLATLYAWFDSQSCDPMMIQSYLVALLREGRPLPPPLVAFDIDRETAWQDAFTDDVSAKIVSSGVQFILAHEVGHLLLGHRPGLDGADSQAQEIAADAFALDHFARIGGMPTGALYYFIAAWWRDPVGDAVADGTHPVSHARIDAVAARLAATPMSFAFADDDPQAGARAASHIAGQMSAIVDVMTDERMLTVLPEELSRDFPVSRLASACPTP